MTPPDRDRLLDDLFPTPAEAPADAARVWSRISQQRRQRTRRRVASGAAALAAAGMVAWHFTPEPHVAAEVEPSLPPPAPAEKPAVRFINDDELLAALGENVPAAVATLPDGTKRLLLVTPRR